MNDTKPKFIKPILIDLDDQSSNDWNNDLFEISDIIVHAPDIRDGSGGGY